MFIPNYSQMTQAVQQLRSATGGSNQVAGSNPTQSSSVGAIPTVLPSQDSGGLQELSGRVDALESGMGQDPNQVPQVDPLTGMPIFQTRPVQQQAPLPQVPGNELGFTKPVFNDKDQSVANGIFGDVQQRQNSVNPQFINPTY